MNNYVWFKPTEVRWILDELEQRGCVVEYNCDVVVGKQFILIELA